MASSRDTWLEIVLAVAQQNDGAAHRSRLLLLQQLVPAGKVERVVHRRAPARPQHAHAGRKILRAIGEILRNFRGGVETDHERLVIVRANDRVQKFDGRILLELESVAHRVTRVHQQTHLQRQIGLAAEAAQFRGLLIVGHSEVAFFRSLI